MSQEEKKFSQNSIVEDIKFPETTVARRGRLPGYKNKFFQEVDLVT